MSMKKKLKIVFLLILAAAVCVVFVLCYKAGVNMTLRRLISQEEEQEKEEEAPAPTPTAGSDCRAGTDFGAFGCPTEEVHLSSF